jgi:signal transduction histidine kinase
MESVNWLLSIRKSWISQAVLSLANSSGMRESATDLAEQFFDLLVNALEQNNPAILESLLNGWAKSLTQSDLEGSNSRLISLIEELSTVTFKTIREKLTASQALELTGALLPYFNFSYSRAAQLEMDVKVAYLTQQLDQVKLSLEKLDRSKSDFIAVAAHELKTPLTLIDGYATMLSENLEQAGLLSYQQVLMEGVKNGARRLQSIIDDMIDVSLIDNLYGSIVF